MCSGPCKSIEVWSTREGEQRFNTHVDKLMIYIRFGQASGDVSEKTAIRVRTRHSQMAWEGQWRGMLVTYGYRLEFQGRMNKKNQPVRNLVIEEDEAEGSGRFTGSSPLRAMVATGSPVT